MFLKGTPKCLVNNASSWWWSKKTYGMVAEWWNWTPIKWLGGQMHL